MLIDFESIPNELFKVIDRFVALNREVVEDASLCRVKWHPEEGLLDQLNLRDGK